MGFFAAELADILDRHRRVNDTSLWDELERMGVHPAQIERLQQAVEDFEHVVTLPLHTLQPLRQELGLIPLEWARLQAGVEADTFLRLLLYHNFPMEEAANKANAVFAAALKDHLAKGAYSENIFAPVLQHPPQVSAKQPRRRKHKPAENVAPIG